MHDLKTRARALDRDDPLAALRELFDLPAGQVYLDGNSLGALPRAVMPAVQAAVQEQWGQSLIGSWNKHRWINLPLEVGERIARLIGAAPGQVVCVDSISVNVFKLLAVALSLRPGRTTVLGMAGDFPTDGYMAQGLSALLGEHRCRLRMATECELLKALDQDVAVLMLTQVNYRSGELYDMAAISAAAHRAGALVLWDLAHSAGALPIDLDAAAVDMAVGCGYKYLNGGPGAPAFIYLNAQHQAAAVQPLAGWFGHGAPFDFSETYVPAPGMQRFQVGTPPIISMVALNAALQVFEGVPMAELRRKSLALSEFFLAGIEVCGLGREFCCITPAAPARRGSQLSFRHESAWGISQALIQAGVTVDFRAPDVVRFGFTPLYTRFEDLAKALEILAEVLAAKSYTALSVTKRPAVT